MMYEDDAWTDAEVLAFVKQKCTDSGFFMNRIVMRLADMVERKERKSAYDKRIELRMLAEKLVPRFLKRRL